jgi:hypothetical protein
VCVRFVSDAPPQELVDSSSHGATERVGLTHAVDAVECMGEDAQRQVFQLAVG